MDDDVDVTDLNMVVWAMSTRCNPSQDIETVDRCWSGPLDPIIPPERRGFNSRAIIDATRPYEWRDQFPKPARVSARLEREMIKKWGADFFTAAWKP